MSFLKRALIVIIALTFVGCSVITLSYNRLPIVAAYQLDSIFDLTDQQSSLARKELDNWLSWHRTTHLPQYATKLKSYEKLIIQDLTPQQFCKEIDVIRIFVDEAVVQFLPALVPIAKTLTPKQIENWNKYQLKNDEEFMTNFGLGRKGEIINERRLEKAIDRAEMFYGTLSAEQKEWIAKRLEKSAFKAELVLPERKRRHNEAVAAVNLIQKGAQPLQTLKNVWKNNQQSPDPKYANYSEQMLKDGCAQLSELHNRTTPEQRLKAAQKLQGYANDFQSLIKP